VVVRAGAVFPARLFLWPICPVGQIIDLPRPAERFLERE
jgi:hypothetical protein